jgi:hypothetical protein
LEITFLHCNRVALLQVTYERSHLLLDLLVKIVQYLSVTGNSPFHYKGAAIQKFVDLLKIVFRASNERTGHIDQLKRCFKVSCMFVFLLLLLLLFPLWLPLEHGALMKLPVSLQFLNLGTSVGLLG